jgi:Zn-dependent protease with chaperone function
MDFFESQDNARRATRRLVILFAIAVVALIVSIYLVALFVFGRQEIADAAAGGVAAAGGFWQPVLFGVVAVATLIVIGAGSGWKTYQLSGGGSVVAELLGGRVVSPSTKDRDERRLLNVVEEMALASGIPVPTVYLLEREQGINAFAAGFSQSDAVIGVTRGTMELLSRDELQGVIAHEFSHVLNGDMRLNLRLIGVVHGILVISLIGYFLLRTSGLRGRGDRKGGAGAIVLFGLAVYVLGYIGVLFGKLIKAAVSRQREYLADASGVQFTRNPFGLAGALKKIGGLSGGSKIESPRAHEASHLFFSNALSAGFSQMLSTHPPLVERVRKLEPGFDGVFPPVKLRSAEEKKEAAETSRERLDKVIRPAILATAGAGAAAAGAAGAAGAVAAASIVDSVGSLTQQHLEYVAILLANTPDDLREAVHEPASAEAVILALLLDPSSDVRQRQIEYLRGRVEPVVGAELQKIIPSIGLIPRAARLPLVDLALPALKQMSAGQYDAFHQTVKTLVEMDRKISLFEYTLQRILFRHLAIGFGRAKPPATQYYSLGQLGRECSVVLSALAHFGSTDEAAAGAAFRAGATVLAEEQSTLREDALTFLPRSESRLSEFDSALEKLASISPALKRALLRACETAVAADHAVTIEEGEMLRAIADGLDVPVPPLLPGQRGNG